MREVSNSLSNSGTIINRVPCSVAFEYLSFPADGKRTMAAASDVRRLYSLRCATCPFFLICLLFLRLRKKIASALPVASQAPVFRSSSPVLPATLVGEDCVMGQKNVRAPDRRLVSSRSAPGALRDDSKKGCVVACSRRSDSRVRKKNSRRKKKREMNRGGKGKRVLSPPPFPPVFPVYNLTRFPLTAVLYLNALNRLAV